ncbi:hypothetical protein RchiOBHm_Chr6g0281831 [Rosa chinensis]|uniref:Uncharacterized protein n=1 Tax=Rosa chinensis TaxID=74649 RepID=A0A2P6PTL8_ROSCH|nr:hypothetical protein RchiOBHm_Chr6g0281831 [Rosa chinensis]
MEAMFLICLIRDSEDVFDLFDLFLSSPTPAIRIANAPRLGSFDPERESPAQAAFPVTLLRSTVSGRPSGASLFRSVLAVATSSTSPI